MQGISRRRVLGGAAICGMTIGSIGAIADKTSATATIDSGEFSIPDTTANITGETLTDIEVQTDITYSFESTVAIDSVTLSVAVGVNERSAQIIAEQNTTPTAKSVDTTATLTGSLFDSNEYDIELLQVSDGQRTIRVTGVVEMILTRDESIIATDKLTDSFEITVSKEKVELSGELSANGEVEIKTEAKSD
jgi:hypothetical protein